LLGHVIDHEYPYTERDARDLLVQLCSALKFIHNIDIVHRDVKPENCLVSTIHCVAENSRLRYGGSRPPQNP